MKNFENLEHKQHPVYPTGTQAIMFFDNGYGVSVVRNNNSYGGERGLYELAVLEGNEKKSSMCYTTDITNDVEGYLTPDDVTALMLQVQAL